MPSETPSETVQREEALRHLDELDERYTALGNFWRDMFQPIIQLVNIIEVSILPTSLVVVGIICRAARSILRTSLLAVLEILQAVL
jgi:hypothetical protein